MTEIDFSAQKLDKELKLEILAALMETDEEDIFLPVKKTGN